ncbi:unnamed protein product [Allacma fusca]|uniref:Uncharacterized protein n=1 Tax=Allacma fusca TaxID=39272 RepID=A0A8J2PUY1_9HEXA|nr:unnamed protein product [Allacma fusca]
MSLVLTRNILTRFPVTVLLLVLLSTGFVYVNTAWGLLGVERDEDDSFVQRWYPWDCPGRFLVIVPTGLTGIANGNATRFMHTVR